MDLTSTVLIDFVVHASLFVVGSLVVYFVSLHSC